MTIAQTLATIGNCIYTTAGPPWFLTNGLCENTNFWHPAVFQHYQARYQRSLDGNLYPLTEQEMQFLEADGMILSTYPTDLLLGYSVWWQNRKWFYLTLEFCYEPDDPVEKHHGITMPAYHVYPSASPLFLGEYRGLLSREQVGTFVTQEAQRLTPLLASLHGELLLDLDYTDRSCLHILVPCDEVVAQFAGFAVWQHFLASLFPKAEEPACASLEIEQGMESGSKREEIGASLTP